MAKKPATFETVREIAAGLPGAVEGMSYGTPAFRVGKSLFVRQHQDGESLVVKIDPDERTMRLRTDPETFYITDHYLNYPWILVRLSTVRRALLRELIEDAWRRALPMGFSPVTYPPRREIRGVEHPSRRPSRPENQL